MVLVTVVQAARSVMDVFAGTVVYRREDNTAYLRESDVAPTPLFRED